MAMLGLLMLTGRAEALDRYSVVHGCYAVSVGGKAVEGGPFRMQATTLAEYLLYSKDRRFLGADGLATAPSPATEWKAADAPGDDLTLTNVQSGKSDRYTLTKADGCPEYPEAETNADGTPAGGATPYGETSGVLDAHLHLMAFEFIGGSARCARPWHKYGIPYAMVDCPDHEPGGQGAVLEQALSGRPGPHDTTGWPKFTDWPAYYSYTHEQVYYKWLERAWKGGLRVAVDLLVDNGKLCDVYPYKRNPCDEMNTLRLELQRSREFQDYVDAQEGGPGKGWFRIVKDPFEARRVINQGKLAVVLAIETSRLFECTIWDEVPRCDQAQIDRYMNEFYDAGVRSLQLINKFDNALGGVAGDAGAQGPIVNAGNKLETNRFWRMETCTNEDREHVHDKPQMTQSGEDRLAAAILQMAFPLGTTPFYGPEPHCNQYGLSNLGEYVIRQAMGKGILLDPDHLSVLARRRFMDVVESADYPGVLSSHSWSTPDAFPRIYKLGGTIAPAGDGVKDFVKDWRSHKAVSDGTWPVFGFGFGSDVNGFSAMPPPRDDAEKSPLKYPFKSFDGKVTFDKNKAGERVWDINTEGVAHYGLYADWLADVRQVGGEEMIKDVFKSAEHYLQMWERAVGVPAPRCGSDREDVTRNGVGDVLLRAPVEDLLRSAGQPRERPGRLWQYCVSGKRNSKAKIAAVIGPDERVALVASTARGHRAGSVAPGKRAAGRLRGTRAFGRGVRIRPAGKNARFVYGIRKGRVRYVAVVTRDAAKSRKRLAGYLKLAGLR
jgi:microsomal dipeptidase-like Zn-dependent dipeptidase